LGNIKFDVAIDEQILTAGRQLKQQLFAERLVWIAASTHHNEEAQLLAVYQGLKQHIPQLLLMIVPRHPERFKLVETLCTEQGLIVVTRSSGQTVDATTDVYLADSIGELKMLYAAADLAFVGGSLVAVGGHNVLEPACVGMPIMFGPQMFNFQEIAQRMLSDEAAVQCLDADDVSSAIMSIYHSEEYSTRLAENAKSFVKHNQGATARVAQLLAQQL
jgi:3-deoxy-D-manno-octulosonic-acid transferase